MALTLSLNSSLFLYNEMKAAAKTAMTAITMPTGPVSAVIALPNSPVTFVAPEMTFITEPTFLMTFPMPVISLPPTSSTGPTAAAIAAILMMVSFVLSSRLVSQLTMAVIFSTAFCTMGASRSPKEMARPSTADFSVRKEPPRPLSMVSAICWAAPSLPSM